MSLLIQQLQDSGIEVSTLWDFLEFNPFAVEFRYDALDSNEALDRPTMLQKVKDLFEQVQKIISTF